MTATAAVRSSDGLGDVRIADMCFSAWRAVCDDGLCHLTPEQMKELESLGMVEMREAPKRWPEAQYGYVMTGQGELLGRKWRVHCARQSPNDQAER